MAARSRRRWIHEGIDDPFVEKGPMVWYWYQPRWLKLTGSN